LPVRLLITVALLGVCWAAVGKEPALHDHMAVGLGSLGERIQGWLAKPAAPAVSGTEPGEGRVDSRPVLVETAPVEFRTVALVSDGGVFALGARGDVKTCGPECTAERFPVITGVKVQEVPGTMGVMLKTAVDMEVVNAVLRAPWVEQLSEINLAGLPALVLFTRDAVKIKVNVDSQLEPNLKRVATVLKDLQARGQQAFTVDVRYKNQIVVKPRSRR
jgi:hypothetical protein